MHSEDGSLTDPQYQLRAGMIINAIHSSREVPPNVSMTTGIAPARVTKQSSMEETVASAVAVAAISI